MTQNEAIKIIEAEHLGKHCFDGSDISEDIIGIRENNGCWEVYDTSERGNLEVIKKYSNKSDALNHMIKGLRVKKRIGERYQK